MPLMIELKGGEKIIVNGAVLENAGSTASLRVLNESSVLRQSEVMTEAEAVTPAGRVYFCLQCAYLFPEKRDEHINMFAGYLEDYLAACPSMLEEGKQLVEMVKGEQFYRGLKLARKLLKHEEALLKNLPLDKQAEFKGE